MVVEIGDTSMNGPNKQYGSGVGLQTHASASYTIGSEVACTDGTCGKLIWVVVDPVARCLTHLVVAPVDHQDLGRLVPVDLVHSIGERICLTCNLVGFAGLERSQETEFVPVESDEWGYACDQMRSWPYYGLGFDGRGSESALGMGPGTGKPQAPETVTYDHVPLGEVDVHRGDHVHATDGMIGSVQGLVIDPSDHHVTHFLLQEGHLWGRKQVAIPIGAVDGLEAGVHLRLSKHEVHDLPPVDLITSP
jgi:hypothetical protein